jgi:hypothetical protein
VTVTSFNTTGAATVVVVVDVEDVEDPSSVVVEVDVAPIEVVDPDPRVVVDDVVDPVTVVVPGAVLVEGSTAVVVAFVAPVVVGPVWALTGDHENAVMTMMLMIPAITFRKDRCCFCVNETRREAWLNIVRSTPNAPPMDASREYFHDRTGAGQPESSAPHCCDYTTRLFMTQQSSVWLPTSNINILNVCTRRTMIVSLILITQKRLGERRFIPEQIFARTEQKPS